MPPAPTPHIPGSYLEAPPLRRRLSGGLFALLALCWLVSFVLGVVSGSDVWFARARRFRHWIWLTGLFWFNVEIWGSVAWTLWHWKG